MKPKHLLIGALLVLAVLLLAACQSQAPAPAQDTTPCPECPQPEPCPTAEPCPDCPECPTPVVENVPFQDLWANSAHADAEAEAFVHWNEDDPAQVPESCAKCHSTPGYQDYLGADGSEVFVVNNPAPIGTVITCEACHNEATAALDVVPFPSGVEIDVEGPSARCAVCHQGRASTVDVATAIEEAGLTDQPDTVSEDLGFINIHYFAAAATLYGEQAHGGFEYEGQAYTAKFDHVEGYDTCVGCHSPHSLELKVDECQVCHEGVTSVEDLSNIRWEASLRDYDGDGDMEEGIAGEIQTLQEKLLGGIQAYATEVAGTAIGYNQASHPYFFVDANGDGEISDDEAVRDNAYASWTPRLLKAAYNYQVSVKDPGAFAHNGKYIIELLHDSIADLNESLSTPVDLTGASRDDAGHFDGSAEAFRHWDEEGMVEASCARCHSAVGLPMYLEFGTTIGVPTASGLNCATCHGELPPAAENVRPVEDVTMPSGSTVSFEDPIANICMVCHQGRMSGSAVDALIQRVGVGPDEPSESLRFQNPHYFAAGATLFGSEAAGAYQYEGQAYAGQNTHVEPFDTCIECHNAHALTINTDGCQNCHAGADNQEALRDIRMTEGDFDGDGNAEEGIAMEIETMHEQLYAAIQDYATNVAGTSIIYNGSRYPYFFADANGNGEVDEDEGNYASWTPTLLRAAYNYQWVAKDPGAFAHNSTYIMQILYDSIDSVGGDVAGMTRPAAGGG